MRNQHDQVPRGQRNVQETNLEQQGVDPNQSNAFKREALHSKQNQMDNFSCGDSSWSEDVFYSETYAQKNYSEEQNKRNPTEFSSIHIGSSSKTVDIAHPITHPAKKLSQLQRTFVSSPTATNILQANQHSSNQKPIDNSTPTQPTASLINASTTDQSIDPSNEIAHPRETDCIRQNKLSSFQPEMSTARNASENFCGSSSTRNMYINQNLKSNLSPTSSAQCAAIDSDTFPHETPFQSESLSNEQITRRQPSLYNAQGGVVTTSASGESASSGFLSSSPQTNFVIHSIERSTDNFINFQPLLAENRHQERESRTKEKEENVYDEVYEDESKDYQSISDTASLNCAESKLCYPRPEFQYHSDEEFCTSKGQTKTISKPINEPIKQKKLNRSIKLFKKSKKNKKNHAEQELQSEEQFLSPSYDDEPIVPRVEGWEEIDFHSKNNFPGSLETAIDDSFSNFTKDKSREHGFLTMLPKNRPRKQIPKLRKSEKEWTISNNPRPVPTPSVPRKT